MHALSGRIEEQCKRDDEVINEHLDMLIELLLGYKVNEWILVFLFIPNQPIISRQDLCKRFEEALQNEQKATQKANNQQRRSAPDTSAKVNMISRN
jgi:hypothetical protein